MHGNAVPRSQLLSTTVIYMPRLITPSLSSKSLPGDPGVSRSLSSQIDPPLATVDAPSISSFNSVVNSCELSSHDADASETPERHLIRDTESDGAEVTSALACSSWTDVADRGDVGDAYSACKCARKSENFSVA